MNIQALTKTHLEACAEIFIDTYNSPPWNYQWNLEGAIKYLSEYLSSADFAGFVLYDNEEIAGAILAHSKTWWTNKQLYIDELFIAPKAQKKGFGNNLINHAEKYALDNDLKTITLMTHKFMPSMKFYENNDFIHAQPFVLLFKNVQPD
ncbi:GNAT family N-acetyltransferase [Mucilaginibacter sp.]|uniref:GNAT family N-acetyltransferase n=1 Tax=Mucilaginibacter sp. TaxID=1882438 RepID=UPI00262F33B7|nr:GNAT family N-acetyltransferase [Mucilaginibacter sp.]MDB4925290.1 family N-acetyltransferase [Mucilaginibacter sp.]